MNIFKLNLAAPRHAVEPSVLAQRLPQLSSVIARCCAAQHGVLQAGVELASTVAVYAAKLSVERSYIALHSLPMLGQEQRQTLMLQCEQWCSELGDDLVFTPSTDLQNTCLGHLNIAMPLPTPANFIGRDVATALPKSPPAKALRQLFNLSQMQLHASPLQGSDVNSLWFCNSVQPTSLGTLYLQHGLAAWWDALADWDAEMALLLTQALNQGELSVQIHWADFAFKVQLRPRASWQFWNKPANLLDLLHTGNT